MVTKWGFSSKLGVQYLDDKEKFSGETQSIIDTEVRQLLDDSYARATTLLSAHKAELTLIAKALMEHETLSGAEVADVVKGKALNLRVRSQKASREPKPMPEQKKKKTVLPPVAVIPKPTVASHNIATPTPAPATVAAAPAPTAVAVATPPTAPTAVQRQSEKKSSPPNNSDTPIRGPPVAPPK
jgi:ATP-dependent metalloprotease